MLVIPKRSLMSPGLPLGMYTVNQGPAAMCVFSLDVEHRSWYLALLIFTLHRTYLNNQTDPNEHLGSTVNH